MGAIVSQGQQLEIRAARASARLEEIARRRSQTEARVGAAKRFLECAPKVQEVLEEAQRRVNQEVVGGLSDLLTYLLQGVMGDPDRAIVCETEVDGRGMSQVRFSVRRSNGETEDILSGNGGSIANVVCTGLRLIAVHRAKRMRRLLVLDEPDCWLSPDRVPGFVGLLQKAVTSMPQDIQVLMITHHDVTDVEEPVNTLELVRSTGSLRVKAAIVRPPSAGQIESLELRNWRSHRHTVLPLGGGLTVLKGANNLGKSAIVESLRCLAYGGARTDVVAHGETEARVTLCLTGGQKVELLRKRRGAPAVTYRWLGTDGQVLREDFGGKGAGAVPEWMREALGIWEVDGQQIHIADQKQPIFLLDQPATKQTAILAVGQEAQAIVAMLDRYKEAKREAQQTVREGEAVLERMRRLQMALGDSQSWREDAQALATQAGAIEAGVRDQEALRVLVEPLRRLHPLLDSQLPAPAALPELQDDVAVRRLSDAIAKLKDVRALQAPPATSLPELHDAAPLRSLHKGLSKLAVLRDRKIPACPSAPEIRDAQGPRAVLETIKRLRPVQRLDLPESPAALDPKDDSAIKDLMARFLRVQEEGAQARQENTKAKADYATQTEVLRQLESDLGCCPLCGESFHEGAAVCR